jgi:hypothetical protein
MNGEKSVGRRKTKRKNIESRGTTYSFTQMLPTASTFDIFPFDLSAAHRKITP